MRQVDSNEVLSNKEGSPDEVISAAEAISRLSLNFSGFSKGAGPVVDVTSIKKEDLDTTPKRGITQATNENNDPSDDSVKVGEDQENFERLRHIRFPERPKTKNLPNNIRNRRSRRFGW